MNEKDYWFPPKRYGWGWGPPRKWQGWAVLAVYFATIVVTIRYFLPTTTGYPFIIGIVVPTLLLILICLLKGAPFGWHWDDK